MAYDAAKAHEYYIKYRKKGLKKGRKKGKKTTSNKGLLATSTAGLSTEGKMQAALIKEDFKKQMNEALKNAKTDEERKQIRLDYSRKAAEAINKLKSNPENVKAATSKSKSDSPGSKSSGKSGTSGGATASSTGSTGSTTGTKSLSAETKKALDNLNQRINEILSSDSISKLSEQEKADLKAQLSGMINKLKKLRGK